jgi:O-antigen/teichoic acid export membrane protein
LFFRGETFIRLWMGPQYAHPAAVVMKILLLSVVFSSANSTSGGVAYGMEKLKRVTLWAVVEATVNLTLSVILVRKIGIYGVAWGTAIPSAIIEVLLWPRYVCQLVAMPVRTYLWQTWFRTALAVVPFAVACAVVERLWAAHNLAIFFLQIAALLPLLPLALALIFRSEFTAQIREWKKLRSESGHLNNEYESSTTTVG